QRRELPRGQDLILGFRMSIDDTQALAVKKARPYFEEHAKFMGPLGMLRYSEEHVKAVAERRAQSPTAATIENGVQNRTWLCGPAEEFIGYLKEVERRYPGLEHVMVSCPLGTPRKMMKENLTRFAREVMPAFKQLRRSPPLIDSTVDASYGPRIGLTGSPFRAWEQRCTFAPLPPGFRGPS